MAGLKLRVDAMLGVTERARGLCDGDTLLVIDRRDCFRGDKGLAMEAVAGTERG